MRHMRPWGHLGMIFTQGLAWAVLAFCVYTTPAVFAFYFGLYVALRVAMTLIVGSVGLERNNLLKLCLLIPVWDAFAFAMWIASFTRKTVRWRGGHYYIRDGKLVPAT